MTMNIDKIFIGIVIILLSAGCSEELFSPDFSVNDSGEVSSSAEVSLEKFNDKVVGHGWKCVSFRDVKDNGSLATQEESYRDGWGPSDYYFDESTVTSFFNVMAWFAACYSTSGYSFEDSTVHIGSGNELRLLKLSGGEFTCVSRIGWNYSGEGEAPIPHYMYFKYKRMTEKELQEYREKYTTDFDSILNSDKVN